MSLDRKACSNSRINLRVTLHVPALLPLVWIMCLSDWRARYGSTTGPDHTRAEAKQFLICDYNSTVVLMFSMLTLLSLFLKWLLANVIQVFAISKLNYCILIKVTWVVSLLLEVQGLPLCSGSDRLVTHRVSAAAALRDGKWQCVCRGSQLTSWPSFPFRCRSSSPPSL